MRGTLREAAIAVAIVGARAAFQEDLDRAAALAAWVAGRGGVVVSGGALGVDAAAHRAALDAGGETVAVLGTGIDRVYPADHADLFDRIAAQGALVSQFARGVDVRGGTFVRRNATIAALADVVVVVGASARSGSLHTAQAARRLGRVVGAVPGADGCERLIAEGAGVVESNLDLARCLAGEPRRATVELPDAGSPDRILLDALSDRDPRDLEDLTCRTGLPLRVAQRALADLELRGLVLLAPGQAYVRSPLVAATA